MKNKRESGEVVVEASIVVTLVMIVITIMLYVGMILYQQTLVSVMANQTASNIAQVYSNNLKDPFTGYVDPDRVYQSITYSNMKTDAYMDVIEQKANIFAKYRLKSSRILATGNTSVEIDIVKKPNELLKSQIVVTIRDSYDIPLVGMFGTDGLVEFGSIGRADCVDILEYINGVEAIGNPEESNVSFLPDSKNCTVTFIPDRNDPSNSTTLTVLKGKSIISSNKYTHCVMPANPTNGSFEFAGWVDDSGRSFTASSTVDNNIVVYGQWKCKVTLVANGGKINSKDEDSFKVVVGNRTKLNTPERSGYNFLGWFDSNGAQYYSNDTPITHDVVLTAKWERRIHTVTFDANGGSLPAGVSSTVTVVYNSTVGMPTAKRQTYVFGGWYDSNGNLYTSSTRITSNITLYAKWTECTSHRMGDCGVDHTVDFSFSWHKEKYYGTTKVRCCVCVDCGCFLDGSTGNRINPTLKKRYNSDDKISSSVWCSVHKTAKGGTTHDTHLDTSDGSYYVH